MLTFIHGLLSIGCASAFLAHFHAVQGYSQVGRGKSCNLACSFFPIHDGFHWKNRPRHGCRRGSEKLWQFQYRQSSSITSPQEHVTMIREMRSPCRSTET
jgi:hypothetical protein